AHDSAVLHELREDVPGHVDGNGKTNALRGLDDRRVDADDLAGGVDERPAAVARIEGSVGLNDVVNQMAGDGAQASSQGADHAGGDGGLKSQGTADRDHELPNPQLGGISQRSVGQMTSFGLDHRQVGPGITANQSAGEVEAIDRANADPLVRADDM